MSPDRIYKQSLSKREKLKSEKIISALFERGNAIKAYPLKLLYLEKSTEVNSDYPLLFAVSVPKRLIRKAVHRNRIKRMVREAYRLNCLNLKKKASIEGKQFSFMFIYINKEIPEYHHLSSKVISLLDKLEKSF